MSDFLETLKAGKKVMETIEENISTNYLIDGKSAKDWQTYFKISIPSNASLIDLRRCVAKLTELLSLATFYRANAQLINDAIEQGAHNTYITKFEEKVTEYKQADKKLPSQKTLEALAETSMKELNGAQANAGMKLRFWKHLMDGLVEQRKALETIMWTLQIEAKTTGIS